MLDKFINFFFKKATVNTLPNKSILFIDDSELDRRLIERILIKKNYKVMLSADGKRAWRWLFANARIFYIC